MEVIAPELGMSQDLKEEVEAVNVAEVDLEEVEEVATTVEEAVVVLQQDNLSATTARTSDILQEIALSLEKKDHQEMMTTHKIVEDTSEEKTTKEETSTTTTIMVVEKQEVDPVGITSKMKVREALGTKETSNGEEATISTPIDQVKTLPKEQVVAGADLVLKEARTIHKIILQAVVGTEKCLQITNSYVSNA